MKVKVVDEICGAGKTTQIMKEIKESKDKRWMFVSPYLSEVGDGREVGRIRETLPEMDFKTPVEKDGKGKGVNLKELLSVGSNVAITHRLLTLMDRECVQLLKENNYNIVIDETLDVISVYKDVHRDDIKGLVGSYVNKDEVTGRLTWNYDVYGEDYRGYFKVIKDMCDLDSLYLHKGAVLINKLSAQIIKAADSVTILTYMFEGSFMCSWLKLSGIEFEYKTIETRFPPNTIKQGVRDNLEICTTPRSIYNLNFDSRGLNLNTAYSVTWYKNNIEKLDDIKRGCQSFLTKLRKDKYKHSVFWTTFKDYRDSLSGSGYTKGVVICSDGTRIDPFVAKNKRASNEYADCNVCMYLVNVYAHGDISSYLEGQGLELDNDKMALSEMVQFIFRGSIRKGEKMKLMLSSERMKKILIEWLESDE